MKEILEESGGASPEPFTIRRACKSDLATGVDGMPPVQALVVWDDALRGKSVVQSTEHCGCTVVGSGMRLDAGIRVGETGASDAVLSFPQTRP